jgi:hypothetical protein
MKMNMGENYEAIIWLVVPMVMGKVFSHGYGKGFFPRLWERFFPMVMGKVFSQGYGKRPFPLRK